MTTFAPGYINGTTSGADAYRPARELENQRRDRWLVWANRRGGCTALARWESPRECRLLRAATVDQLIQRMDDLEREYPPPHAPARGEPSGDLRPANPDSHATTALFRHTADELTERDEW